MPSPQTKRSGASVIRHDLAVVEVEDDLVVYDAARSVCHVLSGGAVTVWAALEGTTTADIVDRVCQRVGRDRREIGGEVESVIADLERLQLLIPATTETPAR